MAQIKQILKPVASLNVGSVTLLYDSAGSVALGNITQNDYTTVKTYTIPVSELKNQARQILDYDVAWTGRITNGQTSKWRILLNDVQVSSFEPTGGETIPHSISFRIRDYSADNVIKIQAWTNQAATQALVTLVSISSRVLTYV